MTSQINSILTTLYSKANPKNIAGMARFGIVSSNPVLGISTPFLKSLSKDIGINQELALELWQTRILEARIVAALIADPDKMTKAIMNCWVRDFDNWAICDGVCIHCFRKTPQAHEIIQVWIRSNQEFIRRAGFTMIATLAVHDKLSSDKIFLPYLRMIKRYSTDERNFVKKAVNWALRQIGKRNSALNAIGIKTAEEILRMNSPSAKWISSDALRELRSTPVQNRLRIVKKAQRNRRN